MHFTPIIPENIDPQILELSQDLYIKSVKLKASVNEMVYESLKDTLSVVNAYFALPLNDKNIEFKTLYNLATNHASIKNSQPYIPFESFIKVEKTLTKSKCENPYKKEWIENIHTLYYSQQGMESFLHSPKDDLYMQPGHLRKANVKIDKKQDSSFGLISLFLTQFETIYFASLQKDKISKLIHAICSYHRLLWIYPFLFDNEIIAKIFLDFLLRYIDVQGCEMWSFSRAIRRHEDEYKKLLINANEKVTLVNDGEGPLTNIGLKEFLNFMLKIANEEVDFMLKNMHDFPSKVKEYVRLSQEDGFLSEPLPKESEPLIEQLLLYGKVKKSDVKKIINKQDRAVTFTLNRLTKLDLIKINSKTDEISLKFNAHFFSHLFPKILS